MKSCTKEKQKKNIAIFVLRMFAIGCLIVIIYIAQVKIPNKYQKRKIEYKNMQITILDSISEQDMQEEFQNLPVSDQKIIQSSFSDIANKKVPHY